jgi:hypothetical protein
VRIEDGTVMLDADELRDLAVDDSKAAA